MNKNIVFFDIDGTIISDETRIIPDSCVTAIKKIQENGHLAFINTGRPTSELTQKIRDLNFDGYICGCGTYVEYKDKILLNKELGPDLSKEVANDITKYNLEAILEGSKDVYWDKPENIKNKTVLQLKDQHRYEGFYKGYTWYREDVNIVKLVIFLKPDSKFNEFRKKYEKIFDFIKRDESFYELVPLGYSKASGIEFICDYLDIPRENTYALGDSTNDLPMLEYAAHSIAMGNSTPSIFDSVSYITTSVDEDGIYIALKHYNML